VTAGGFPRRPRGGDRGRRACGAGLLVTGAAALAAAGCGLLPGEPAGGKTVAAAIPVTRTDLRITVQAAGELVALQDSPIAVPQVPTGALKVSEVVAEGAVVEPGDVIVVFDDTQLSVDLANHTATFRSAGRQIDRSHIRWGKESGTIRLERLVAELERDYAAEFQLEDEAIYSQMEILDATLSKEYADEKIVFADARLLLRGEYYDIDERILRVEKDQARGKIERAQTSLGRLVLSAPSGGMVVYRENWRGATITVGDTLWPGNVILSIVDPTRAALKVNVLERDAAAVQTGAVAEVRIDARAERVFPARVESLAKHSRPIEQGSPVKYFEARVHLNDGDPELLKPGMTGQARILVAELEDAVVIPRAAVRGTNGGYHVLVDGPAGPQRRPVRLGPGDRVRVSVQEGLAPGESVLITDIPADGPSADRIGTGQAAAATRKPAS
jgi:multidrug efflux pump subunit AcrA (membrane-fusion protein)